MLVGWGPRQGRRALGANSMGKEARVFSVMALRRRVGSRLRLGANCIGKDARVFPVMALRAWCGGVRVGAGRGGVGLNWVGSIWVWWDARQC